MTPPHLSSTKILLVHATAGAGHTKAAEAVFHGLEKRAPKTAVIIDALDHTSPFFRVAYSKGYEFMVGKMPTFWAGFFALTDQRWFLPVFRFIRRIYNGMNAGPLVKFVREGNFDVVVSVHFFSAEVLGWMRRTGQLKAKVVVIVTDYDVHHIWVVDGVDEYCVASEFTRSRLVKMGVDENKIFVTGIPVDEKFTVVRDKKEVRGRLGLDAQKFTILLSTSSFGFGPIEELAELLHEEQMIIICGNNKELFGRLTQKANPLHKICKFVNNMEELMAASDVMITKPGGLSITEALANNLPLIFFSAIPGQEAGNVRVLAANGIGWSDLALADIASTIRGLSCSPAAFHEAREKTKALARPHSVQDIIKRLI
ncbi:MAG: hypothetical protein HQL19_04540 [Candidatus Omnitrophica bacterium]|nr:hypothetical protein [Candidatus Omnitrophota bacterium]